MTKALIPRIQVHYEMELRTKLRWFCGMSIIYIHYLNIIKKKEK